MFINLYLFLDNKIRNFVIDHEREHTFCYMNFQIVNLSEELGTIRMDLTSVEGRSQHRINEVLSNLNASLTAIEEIVSGKDTISNLAHGFNTTIERAIKRAQNATEVRLQIKMDEQMHSLKQQVISHTTTVSPIQQDQFYPKFSERSEKQNSPVLQTPQAGEDQAKVNASKVESLRLTSLKVTTEPTTLIGNINASGIVIAADKVRSTGTSQSSLPDKAPPA